MKKTILIAIGAISLTFLACNTKGTDKDVTNSDSLIVVAADTTKIDSIECPKDSIKKIEVAEKK